MQTSSNILIDMAPGTLALIAVVCVLLVMLCASVMRYRRLRLSSDEDRDNNRELIENLSEGIYRSTLDGRQLRANRALVQLNGYSSLSEMLSGVTDIAMEWYVDPARREEFRRLLHRDGSVVDFISEIYRHKTRERIWITESARIVRDKRTGKPMFYEGSVREITETVKRLKLEEHYKKLINQIPGGLFQYKRDTSGKFTITYLSRGFHRLTGIPEDQPLSDVKMFTRLIAEEDRESYDNSLRECFRTHTGWDHEFRIRTVDGVEKWVRATAEPERVADGVIWHGYTSDISIRKRQEIEIRQLAYFDPLTRLPNRRMLLDRLALTLPKCRAHGRRGALLFIDLDNFKTLNDTQGHDVGDAYLVQVAKRLKSCVRADDLVARIGGDEFVVVIEDAGVDEATASARAITIAGQVLTELGSVFEVGAIQHQASASVGVVLYDGTEARVDEILKRADIAMYKAKGAGRNAMAIFDPAAMLRESERYAMLTDLRAALVQDQFQLHFQPQMDRAGRVCGAEALVRWYHPEKGIIAPDQFIPLAEQSGLINELGKLVLAKGIAALCEWQADAAMSDIRLSINVSVKSFGSADFLPHIEGLIGGIDPTKLTLEFTEHVMADNHADTACRMHRLKRLGVSFSLDDFGTGYSSLACLRQLPFDEVKIDGSFVADIETKESDRALVRTILAMAETLGLVAVAEHVENERQEAFLKSFGCDLYQGYLYSPAVPAPAFLELARKTNGAFRTIDAGEQRQSA
ncbi:MAG: EAL domain-containing protein [Mesorhizobium sp.]|nr:EAL domain-containing protein [Mesorhizobium sp.]